MTGRAIVVWAIALGLAASAAAAPTPSPGVVIEIVQPGTTADRAGLAPGDVITSWSAAPAAGGLLLSPFDLIPVFIEELPRRQVVLTGRRSNEPRTWRLPAGFPSPWQEIEVRPVLGEALLSVYQAGKEQIALGRLNEGLELWREAAASEAARADPIALWLSVRRAQALGRAERWAEADLLYHELLAPRETRETGDPVVAQLLREWGDAFRQRRIWDLAEDCFRRALAMDRKVAPQSLAAARSLAGLGDIANWNGGSQAPETFFREALAILAALAPASSDVAAVWQTWGQDMASSGDWATAARHFRQAVEIQEKVAPQSLYLAERLMIAGTAEYFQSRLEAAEALWQRALAITRKEAPESLIMVGILQGLGNSATRRGDLRQAEGWLKQALALLDDLAPSDPGTADLLTDLGLVERQLGNKPASAEYLCRAVEAVERYRKRLERHSEARLRWGFWFAENYRACADALFDLGEGEKSFQIVERGRARSFLSQLAERDLRLSGLPAPQAASWASLNAAYDAVQGELAKLTSAPKRDMPAIWRLSGKLREIRQQKERILSTSLPLGALRHPEPLDLPETRRALDPGTVLLVFSTAEHRTLLFVARPSGAAGPGFAVHPVEVKAAELRKRVTLFRDAILKDRFNRRVLEAQGKALYDLLLRPAEPFLADAERVLIVPDGVLHVLPFAALVRDGAPLIQWKPIHFAVSATAYRELQKRRHPGKAVESGKLVAFGDPLHPPLLPDSRTEVESIARLFPGAQVHLGREANERQARNLGKEARWLHFAVHGRLDEQNPLNSALVLSLPQKGGAAGNGLLQAWEVMEDLELDADLVTLSACDSALGREGGGEGLIGLTRAFHYAGARSVLAALWGVADRSTAVFMSRFYASLRAGQSKDRALQEAQIRQIRESQEAFPYFWASFQLYGDWR